MLKFFFSIFIIAFFLGACDESSTSVYPLSETDFTTEMEDSIFMFIESNGSSIELKGELNLIEGECDVWLTYPVYDTIFETITTYLSDTLFADDSLTLVDSVFIVDSLFSVDTVLNAREIYRETYTATDKFTIDEKFDRIEGEWVFRYELRSLDDVDPSGSLDFKLIYKD